MAESMQLRVQLPSDRKWLLGLLLVLSALCSIWYVLFILPSNESGFIKTLTLTMGILTVNLAAVLAWLLYLDRCKKPILEIASDGIRFPQFLTRTKFWSWREIVVKKTTYKQPMLIVFPKKRRKSARLIFECLSPWLSGIYFFTGYPWYGVLFTWRKTQILNQTLDEVSSFVTQLGHGPIDDVGLLGP